MKTLAASVFALVLSLSAFANEPVTTETTVKGIHKITVGRNIRLVLQGNGSSISMEGKESNIKNVSVRINGDEMFISPKKSIPGGVTVYVPASGISYVDLKNGSSVSTKGEPVLNDLTVFVNEGTSLDLNMIGKVTVKQAPDCDIVYEKNETRLIPVK